MFVPLKIMFPEAEIPCVQLSLINNLDPESHFKLGKALSKLRKENMLILGSGFTFHKHAGFNVLKTLVLISRMRNLNSG